MSSASEFDTTPIEHALAARGYCLNEETKARLRMVMTNLGKRMARCAIHRDRIQHETQLARDRVRVLEEELALARAKIQKQKEDE